MKELISMVDFVLEDKQKFNSYSRIKQYATFLNMPFNIGMFVPAVKVGDKWKGLEYPDKPYFEDVEFRTVGGVSKIYNELIEQYQKAKDNVLFEGKYELHTNKYNTQITFNHSIRFTQIIMNGKTIQDLIELKTTLTKKGLDISGLNNN